MNLFGKILTVIILVLSLLFSFLAVLAGGGVQNWKAQTQALTEEVRQKEALVDSLNAKQQALKTEIGRERLARARALAELQSRKQRLEEEIKSKEDQLQKEKAKATEALTQLAQASQRTTELDKKVEDITRNNNTYISNIAAAAQKLSTVENQLIQLQTELTSKQERLNQLIEKSTLYKSILLANKLDVEAPIRHIEPQISARVTGVLNDLVVFSAGRDDGVREGHTFEIYHGNKFIGVAKVIDLHGGNQATARVISGKDAQVTDSVVTSRTASRG